MSSTLTHPPAFLDELAYLPRVTTHDGRAIEDALAGPTLFDPGVRLRAAIVEATYRTAKGWGIRWYELDGRRACRAGFATKTEARHYFEEQVRPRLWGRAPDMTLAELVDAYLDAHSVGREPRTIRTLRERLKYATDRFGDVKLTELERNPRLIPRGCARCQPAPATGSPRRSARHSRRRSGGG